MKLQLGQQIQIASSTRGFTSLSWTGSRNPDARQHINIAGLQETHNNRESRESEKKSTLFFSEGGARKQYTAGVGVVITKGFAKYVEDLELRGSVQTNIIAACVPPADRTGEEKDGAHEELRRVVDRKGTKAHILTKRLEC